MKKVINITIGKTVFLIEEDAYQKLDEYLRGIRDYFKSDEGGEDVVNDIEYSIAEKFISRGMDSTKSIGDKEVKEIIEEMGTVEELSGDSELNSSEKKKVNSENEKRLYRDTEDMIIAGVASGIARYFAIDPVIVRIIFVFTIFFGGFGVIAYLVLWAIVPPADTASKKINMEGGRVTISEIETFVKKKIEEVPKSKWKKIFSFPFLLIKKIFNVAKIIVSRFGVVLFIIMGAGILFTSLISLFSFSAAVITFISGGAATVPEFTTMVNVLPHGFFGIASMVGIYLIVVIPLIMLAFLGIALIRRKRTFSGLGYVSLFVIWFISGVIVTGVGLSHVNEIRAGINEVQKQYEESYSQKVYDDLTFDLIRVSGNTKVKIVKGEKHSILIEGSEKLLEMISVESDEGVLEIYRNNQFSLCFFFCHEMYSSVVVTIVTPELKGVSFSGSVNGEMEEFQTDEFISRFSGSSKFTVRVISKNLEIKTSGSGNITLIGETDKLLVATSGSARINGYELLAKEVEVKSSGSSRVELSVEEKLDVNSSGSTRVSYIKNGDVVVTEQISGSGTVKEKIIEEEISEEE